jgi:hypothetical protein
MTTTDFRRIALSFPDAAESAHMGPTDFRVGGRIFATLASEHEGFGTDAGRTTTPSPTSPPR